MPDVDDCAHAARDSFAAACGAAGPLVLNLVSPGVSGGETRAFALPFVLVGRDPRCDLCLTDPEVSDRHAYLQLVDGLLLCVDLGSRNGVYQAGKRRRLTCLGPETAVRIGPYRIRLLGGGDAPGRDPGTGTATPRALELAHRSIRRSRCPLPPGLSLIGSAIDCPVRVVDPSVSSHHCGLVHTPDGVWVVDLLAPGGVRVNGHEVSHARLLEGDTLEIGYSVIRFAPPSETRPASPPAPEGVSADPPAPAMKVAAPAQASVPGVSAPLSPENPETVAAAERLLASMVSQVTLLRQQVAEESQQARATLFEAITALRQEQSSFLDQELAQLRRLSQEVHELRGEVERHARLLADRDRLDSPRTTSPPDPAETGEAAPEPGAPADTRRTLALRDPGPLRSPNGFGDPSAPLAASGTREVEETDNLRAGVRPHAALCLRISRMNEEHRSRWQRLLARIPGIAHGKTAL